MATLTRIKDTDNATNVTLSTSIPAPFPREQLAATSQAAAPLIEIEGVTEQPLLEDLEQGSSNLAVDLIPSIAHVQKSCVMALNSILSVSDRWQPIIPDRRHSMPPSPNAAAGIFELGLQTLVDNLRNRDTETMIQGTTTSNDKELINELGRHVDALSETLSLEDARLARSLVSLLSRFHRLSEIQSTSSPMPRRVVAESPAQRGAPLDPFDTLKRQLSDIQIERQATQQNEFTSPPGTPAVTVVESALLWTHIDDELESVLKMCKERADHLPPQYDASDYDMDFPPQYDHELEGKRSSLYDTKSLNNEVASNEKMRMDLETVTLAIDRLYRAVPQLHNQRVELKSSKVLEMERARSLGPSRTMSSKGKQKEEAPDPRELDDLLEMIGRASSRTISGQSVVLEGGMKARLEKAQMRDRIKRDEFVERLAAHSDAGRLHGQDAVLQANRTKNPETMLTLPEFIRESVPESHRHKVELLTLPEFIKEQPQPPPLPLPQTLGRRKSRSFKTELGRARSLSAPSFPWLKQSFSKASGLGSTEVTSPTSTSHVGFDVHYVAEHHENLHHILVFVVITGNTPGEKVEAEVISYSPSRSEGDHLIIRCGSNASPLLVLPAPVAIGKKEVIAQNSHYEVKLPCSPSTPMPATSPLMDATELSGANPSSFSCASCSLPIIYASQISQYRDLPSEHWEELVEAWMCHADQKLHDHVIKHGRGFWPEAGQALVGKSYILFQHSNVVASNVRAGEDKKGDQWKLVRCICGALLGRCQINDDLDSQTTYRLLKFAIRPMNSTFDSVKIPLSAFIVEDMMEFVQAHATYRFVILDEEEERPRVLLWLFKPSMLLSYGSKTNYAIKKNASIHAAKILFKILKPAPNEPPMDLKTIIHKFPGFPQAEYLYYPLSTCRRIAGLLKESNGSYPENMRSMTGLDVGWLARA